MTPPPQNPYDQNNWNQQQNQTFQQNQYYLNQQAGRPPMGMQTDIPNATMVLVLGICAIAIGCAGPILGTIGLMMAKTAKKVYAANPTIYREGSFKQLNAGYICSIIGLCLGVFNWILVVVWFMMVSTIFSAFPHPPFH